MQQTILNDRERDILRDVVRNYIQSAIPVGSRFLSKKIESGLSPASIRIVMSDLEEYGFLSHPHTSAGRVPTDRGYRYYVDYLMEAGTISEHEKRVIEKTLQDAEDKEEMLKAASKLLSKISRQLSIVSSPQLSSGVFERLELVPMSGTKVLVIISLRAGIVRTIMLEVGMELKRERVDDICRLLNERLSGLTLREIRDTLHERLRDAQEESGGLVRLFIDSVDKLFEEQWDKDQVLVAGARNIIEQPEFIDPRHFRSVVELIEDKEAIVHLLQVHEKTEKDFIITIGSENPDTSVSEYSVMTATYGAEGVSGRIGIIGPKRMDYTMLVPLVDHVAKVIASLLAARPS